MCSFPDCQVRQKAVSWIQELSSDELVDYLPQLVQALKHETYEASPLARLLLERGLTSPRVAHHLYWLLTQALPGPSPQVNFTCLRNLNLDYTLTNIRLLLQPINFQGFYSVHC